MWTQIDILNTMMIAIAIVATLAAIFALPKSLTRTSLTVLLVVVVLWGGIILLLKLQELPRAKETPQGNASGNTAPKPEHTAVSKTAEHTASSPVTAAVIPPIPPATNSSSSPTRISTAPHVEILSPHSDTNAEGIRVPVPHERERGMIIPVLHPGERDIIVPVQHEGERGTIVPVPREITSGPFIVRISDCAISTGFLNCMMTVTDAYQPAAFGVWCSSKDPSDWSYVRIGKKIYGPAELHLLDDFPVTLDGDGMGTFKAGWSCGGIVNLAPGDVARIRVRFPHIPSDAKSVDEMFFQSGNYAYSRNDPTPQSAIVRFTNLLIR